MRKSSNLMRKKHHYGRMFLLPWIIGVLLYFLIPLIQSIMYSFENIKLSDIDNPEFVGLSHYITIFKVDPNYLDNVAKSLSSMLYTMPIVVILSLFFAVILNQEFRGRMIARAVFFLPVIIASGVVMDLLMSNGSNNNGTALSTAMGQDRSISSIDFSEILVDLGLPLNITNLLKNYITRIFNLTWSCGIQILLFLAGLQSIPEQLYEVSKIEGASSWEEFWFVTFPMLGNVTFLVLIYTFVDLFTVLDNPVIKQAYNLIQSNSVYDESSAMLWAYFLCAGTVAGLVLLLYNRLLMKKWQ